MKKMALLLCALSLPAFAQTPKEIADTINAKWIQFHDTANAERLTDLYLSDAVLCPPNNPAPIVGQKNIRAFYDELLRQPGENLTIQAIEVRQVGDTIINSGTWSEDTSIGPVSGLYVNVVVKQDDDWKLLADTWNQRPLQ